MYLNLRICYFVPIININAIELTKETISQLIDLHHERPILWDQTQSNY